MQKQMLPKTLLGFFGYFLKKQWKGFLAMQIFSFAWSLDHTMWPYIIMLFIDGITNYVGDKANMWHELATPIFMGLGLWLTVELFFRLSGVASALVIPKLESHVRLSMFDYVQHHSHLYFNNHMAGTIANKIADMPQSMTRILLQIIQLFIPVILALIIAIVLFAKLSPMFAVILTGWICVHISICLAYSKSCDHSSHIHAEARSRLAGKIVDSLSNNNNIKLFSRHRFEYQYLSHFQQDEQAKHLRSLWVIEKMKFALGFASFLCMGVGLNWYMLYSWQQGQLTAGEVIFIFNTSWNIMMMAWIAGLEIPSLFKEIGVCKQALTIIQDRHDIVDAPNAAPLKIKRGEIIFENVTFRYMKDHHLFKDKNLTIQAGQKVGLVGFSGSGKTTFVNLILRYFDIEKGRILIDGQDIAHVALDSLRAQIALIPQDPSLFHRSLMENIRYGRLEATNEEVIEASKKAHCDDFVQRLSAKYETLVGERGAKLSGGQRQRIAIARAILKDAPIFILDEATSALDSVTEREIQDGLEHLMHNRTTIVIAHRLSTLSGMDRILVFKEGAVIEDGSHEELLQQNGHYAAMWNMQVEGFLPDEENKTTETNMQPV